MLGALGRVGGAAADEDGSVHGVDDGDENSDGDGCHGCGIGIDDGGSYHDDDDNSLGHDDDDIAMTTLTTTRAMTTATMTMTAEAAWTMMTTIMDGSLMMNGQG